MPRKPPETPNPIIVTQPPRTGWNSLSDKQNEDLRKLRKDYAEHDAINTATMTPDEHQAYCEILVLAAFTLVGVPKEQSEMCFQACVTKVMETGVIRATKWSSWGGYRDIHEKMKIIATQTIKTGYYHILNATSVIAAITVKNLRRIVTDGKDETTNQMLEFKTFQYAHVSIKHWTPNGPRILKTNVAYTPSTPAMTPIKQWKEQLLQEMRDEEDKNEASEEEEELPESSDVITVDDMLHHNKADIVLQMQQFEALYSHPRPASPPSEIQIQQTLQLTRQQVLSQVQPLWTRIAREKWQESLNEALAEQLTEHSVQVLPSKMKTTLQTWAAQSGKENIQNWIEQAVEDKTTVEWNEIQTKPAPAKWSSTSPAKTVLDDLEHLANFVEGTAARTKIRQSVNQLARYIKWLEMRQSERASTREMLDQTITQALEANQALMTEKMEGIERELKRLRKRKHCRAFEPTAEEEE